jgi:hypothetical protein
MEAFLGHFISFIAVLAFSFNSLAQIEFGPLIEESIVQKDETAEDLHKANQMASNIENTTETTTTTLANNEAQTPTRTTANKKDFSVTLHPTGRSSAQRYFPKAAKVTKTKRSAKVKTKSASKTKSGKIAKTDKKKKVKAKSDRKTASVKKKSPLY